MRKTVLITGATGFVGRSLSTYMTDCDLKFAVRRESPMLPTSAQIEVGELGGDTSWERALESVECVIHLAARVHVMRPSAADESIFHQTNVEGTRRLAEAAARSGVARFVFLSSIKVNGDSTADHRFTADDVPAPSDMYGRSKLDAERCLFDIANATEMTSVAIRAPLVYGAGVGANFLRLIRWVDRGIPLPLGAVVNRRSMVSVWNLCDLIATVASRSRISNSVMMVSDGDDLATPQLIRSIARALGKPARLINVPTPLLHAAGLAFGLRAEIERLSQSLAVDISQTSAAIAWVPSMTVQEGIQRTVDWYKENAVR